MISIPLIVIQKKKVLLKFFVWRIDFFFLMRVYFENKGFMPTYTNAIKIRKYSMTAFLLKWLIEFSRIYVNIPY